MTTLPQRLRQMADHTGLDAVADLLREAATELEHREDLSSLLLAENTSFADQILHHEELLERAALAEQPAEQEPVAWVGLSEADKLEILRANGEAAVMYLTEAKLREKNAEQPAEQEPVAYVCTSSHVTADGSMEDGPDYLEWADEASDYEKRVGTPLYTAPKPAKRKPLTDEEIDLIGFRAVGKVDCQTLKWCVPYGTEIKPLVREIARAIEAAHSITGED